MGRKKEKGMEKGEWKRVNGREGEIGDRRERMSTESTPSVLSSDNKTPHLISLSVHSRISLLHIHI